MTNNRVLPQIINRRSILSFSDRPVEPEKLTLLFEAARWAPSSMNLQPWKFIYSAREDTNNYQKIFDLLFNGNKLWAGSAPVLAVSIAEVVMKYKQRQNRFAYYDLGMAVGNLLVQATSMGLYIHQMGGYDVEKARQVLEIPQRYEPVAILAIGYKGDVNKLPADLKKRELGIRARKDIKEFVYTGGWGRGI